MVQWVNDLALVYGITSWSPGPVQWVKDLALLQLWLRFDPWPGNLHMSQVKLKKEKKRIHLIFSSIVIFKLMPGFHIKDKGNFQDGTDHTHLSRCFGVSLSFSSDHLPPYEPRLGQQAPQLSVPP